MFDINQDSHKTFRSIVAERSRAIVVWTGAGLSMPAGLPSWFGLRDALVNVAREKAPTDIEHQQKQKHLNTLKQASESKNLWTSFQMLKKLLGRTTYRDVIRRQLIVSDQVQIPDTYSLIWKLRPAGVLNLNLDGFVSRAYGAAFPGKHLNQFVGNQAASYTYLLKVAGSVCSQPARDNSRRIKLGLHPR